MAAAGQAGGRFADPRIKCAIAMSAPAPKIGNGYASVAVPVLDMTGTLDDSPVLGGTAQSRLRAFEQLQKSERYLAVFNGGDHMIFSGTAADLRPLLGLPGMSGDRKLDPQFQTQIRALSLAFLEHVLRQDEQAGKWLVEDGGAKAALGEMATWTVGRAE
jgi:predicted dienelactone hydrolase